MFAYNVLPAIPLASGARHNVLGRTQETCERLLAKRRNTDLRRRAHSRSTRLTVEKSELCARQLKFATKTCGLLTSKVVARDHLLDNSLLAVDGLDGLGGAALDQEELVTQVAVPDDVLPSLVGARL